MSDRNTQQIIGFNWDPLHPPLVVLQDHSILFGLILSRNVAFALPGDLSGSSEILLSKRDFDPARAGTYVLVRCNPIVLFLEVGP